MGDDHRYEIVVPILGSEDKPVAVVNVVNSKPLNRDHLRRTELFVYLHQKLKSLRVNLVDFKRWFNTSAERAKDPFGNLSKEALKELVKDPITTLLGTKTSHEICKGLCTLVAILSGANLVRLLLYNPRQEAFLPHGVKLNESSAKEYLDKEGETLDTNGIIKSVYYTNKKDVQQAIHTLLEYVIAWRLLPRPEGSNTWDIFKDGNCVSIPDTNDEKEIRADPFAKAYFDAILGIPFQHDVNAQPDGVLWLSWRPKPSNFEEVANFFAKPSMKSEIGEHIRSLSEVVATVLTIHRCFNPKGVLEPLPRTVPHGD